VIDYFARVLGGKPVSVVGCNPGRGLTDSNRKDGLRLAMVTGSPLNAKGRKPIAERSEA
jgi:hypothetical protein